MRVFVIGATSGVGRLLAERLAAGGHAVRGLARYPSRAPRGVDVVAGDLTHLTASGLGETVQGSDVVVFATGSNGGSTALTDALDGRGLATALAASEAVGVPRFVSLSVLPEAWRERDLSDDEEHYFAVKKRGDVLVSRTRLDWVIVRPSLLTDALATGAVSLGAAELHTEIGRADVAHVLAAVVAEPRLRRRIVEVTTGETPIPDAVGTMLA